MVPPPQTKRRRPHGRRSKGSKRALSGGSPLPHSPISGPPPPKMVDDSLTDNDLLDMDSNKFLLKSKPQHHGNNNSHKWLPSFIRRSSTSTSRHKKAGSNASSCYEYTGLNFIVPALGIWFFILLIVWYPELKDNALDYYYLQYPEQQPLSPIPGTVLPLIPNVWIYNPAQTSDSADAEGPTRTGLGHHNARKKVVQNHLREHKQPHYYMLPQDYYDQQPPSEGVFNATGEDNTAYEFTGKIRGVLIFLHHCHQSGLHFFQLPESRIVAAHALQRGLAIFSPTASSASALLTKPGTKGGRPKDANGGGSQEKNCWSTSLDGDELLGPLLYEWAREMNLVSLPRMAMGVSNGANLLITSSLYKTLRLQSMALYGSFHKDGFDLSDLERDVVPATAFIVFPKSAKATEYAIQNYETLLEHAEQNQEESELRKEEESKDESEKESEEAEEEESDAEEDREKVAAKRKAMLSRKSHVFKVDPHPWTAHLCQGRLPEYHTRCRSFFRHIQQYQKSKIRKQEEKQMKQDPQQRAKRQRLGGGYARMKQKYQLVSTLGEVFQSSKNPNWNPVLESLGLDDWTTHTMAFTLASGRGRTSAKGRQRNSRQKKKKSQLMQFPTTATPEGRSWLWASMLQEVEVAYGLHEMTSEHSPQILDFLMHHAGLSIL